MPGAPKISVIVPAYNAARTLPVTIDSLKALDYPDFEVIVVDDGSSDATAELVRGAGFTLVTMEVNGGAGTARNVGATVATGEILAFTDADCVVPSGWLLGIPQMLAENDVAALSGPYSGSHIASFVPMFTWYLLEVKERAQRSFVRSCTTSNLACRRDDFFAAGGFPRFALGEKSRRAFQGHEDANFGFFASQRLGRKILWEPTFNVVHQFRTGVGEFFREQAFYGEVIFISNCKFPEMARNRESNFNKTSTFLQLLALLCGAAAGVGLAGAGLLTANPLLLAGGAGVLVVGIPVATAAMNHRLLHLVWRKQRSPAWLAGSVGMLMVTYAGWLSGAFVGVLKAARAGFRFPDIEGLPPYRVEGGEER